MRQLIVKTLILDKGTLKRQLRESFYGHIATLIETKVFYELQMASEETTMFKTFTEHGGSKTASAYTCLKVFEAQHGYTNHELELNIKKLNPYLDTKGDDIKEGLLGRFNKEEAEKIISTQPNIEEELIQKLKGDINDIISYCANEMTTDILIHHKEEIRKRNAIATTAATFKCKKTEETTSTVVNALANEGSMSTKTMEDYIEKRIQENLQKNFKHGSKTQKPVNVLQKKGKPTGKPKRKEFDGKDNAKRNEHPNKRMNKNKNLKAGKHNNRDSQKRRQHPPNQYKRNQQGSPPRFQNNRDKNSKNSKNKSWTRNTNSKNHKRGNKHQGGLHNGDRNKRRR